MFRSLSSNGGSDKRLRRVSSTVVAEPGFWVSI